MASTLASHQVKITVVEAQNILRTNDWNEGSDAYCEIKLHGKAQEGTPLKTATQKQTLSPKWNETFAVELSHSPMNDTIEIFCYGEKVLGKLFIGRVEIPVTLLLHGAMVDGWFKLLPLSVMDLTKTVQGHLHLILHYSQVQVPAPAKVPEKAKKTTPTSAYPGSAPTVDCPICSRPFSVLAINAHLDICTQTPAPPTPSKPTPTPAPTQKTEVRACPVCCKTYPVADLNRHVEQCLASQPPAPEPKKKEKKKKTIRAPASESEENAQLQAVLIASKLEAEKNSNEKEKKRDTAPETPYAADTPPSSSPAAYPPFYPSVPYMPYPAGMPPSPYVPYLPPQPIDTPQDGQPPMAYFPPVGMPMYPPPFYAAPGTGQPVMPYPPLNPMVPSSAPATTPTPPKNENLLF